MSEQIYTVPGEARISRAREWISRNGGRILMSVAVVLVTFAAGVLTFVVGGMVSGDKPISNVGIVITPTLLNAAAAFAIALGLLGHALSFMGTQHSSGRILNGIGLGLWVTVTLFLGAVFVALTNMASGKTLTAEMVQQFSQSGDQLAPLVVGGRFVIAAVVPLAILSMVVLTAFGSVTQRGEDHGSKHFGARVVEFVVIILVVLASGLHALEFGLYVGFDVFAALAGAVIAELCFILAKMRSRWGVLMIAGIYLLAVNAAAGVAAGGGLAAVRASIFSPMVEVYSASPIIFGILIAWLLREGRVSTGESFGGRIVDSAQGLRSTWDGTKNALTGDSTTSRLPAPRYAAETEELSQKGKAPAITFQDADKLPEETDFLAPKAKGGKKKK